MACRRGTDNRGIPLSITRVTGTRIKSVHIKACASRERKRAGCVIGLNEDLLEEFERLSKSGLKFSPKLLRDLTIHLVCEPRNAVYRANPKDLNSSKLIIGLISPRWIQAFMSLFQIVSKAQTGKLMVCPAKQTHIEREVAYHLGMVACAFRSGAMNENDVCNADETHFMINLDNHSTLGKCEETEVKYSDVVSGFDGMKMMIRISGGMDTVIEAPFLVFQNMKRSYPIQGVPDNVPGVLYRSDLKGWMDKTIFAQYMAEKNVIKSLPHGRKRITLVDNCGGYGMSQDLVKNLQACNTELRFFHLTLQT